MNVFIEKHNNHASTQSIDTRPYFENAIGFWGTVKKVNAQLNTVDVQSNRGLLAKGLTVISKEWINPQEKSGSRNLPSVGSYVFVLTPYGNLGDAFVLCSTFADGTKYDFLAQQGEDYKNTQSEKTTQGGWHITAGYKDGNIHATSKDGKVDALIALDDNTDANEQKGLSLKWNEWSVTLNDNDGLTLENSNIAVLSIDTEGNITIEGKKSGKFSIKNTAGSLGKIMSDLLQDLANLQTVGSPANHKASPDFQLQMQQLKSTWEQVFNAQ